MAKTERTDGDFGNVIFQGNGNSFLFNVLSWPRGSVIRFALSPLLLSCRLPATSNSLGEFDGYDESRGKPGNSELRRSEMNLDTLFRGILFFRPCEEGYAFNCFRLGLAGRVASLNVGARGGLFDRRS